MNKNTRLNSIWICIESVLLLTLGILTIVYARNHDAWNVIGYIAGVLILIDGLLRLTLFVITRSINVSKAGLYRGIGEVTFGVFLLIRPEIVVQYFTLLIAIGLVVVGLVFVIECIIANIRKSASTWTLIVSYLGSLLLLALGIFALIYYPYSGIANDEINTISILLIVIGVLFIVSSVLIVIVLLSSLKKQEKQDVIENEEIAKKRSEKRGAKQKK